MQWQKLLTLGERVAGIQGHAVFVGNRRVECALHIVNGLWHQTKTQLSIGKKIVQKT